MKNEMIKFVSENFEVIFILFGKLKFKNKQLITILEDHINNLFEKI